MRLKWRLDAAEFETLDTAYQPHYEPDSDGHYRLVVIGPYGDREYPDDSNLKSAFEKVKRERPALKEELDAVLADKAAGGSRAQLELLQRRHQDSEKRRKTIDADGAVALEALKQEWEPRLAEADGKLKVFIDGLDEHAIDSAVRKAIKAARGIPELLTHHVLKRVKVEVDSEGARKVVIVDDDGNTRLDEHGQPVPVDQLVEELRLFGDPALLRAFDRDRNGNGH